MSHVLRRKLASHLPLLADVIRTGSKFLAASRRTVALRSPRNCVPVQNIVAGRFRNCFGGYYDHSPFRPAASDLLLVHATDAAAWRRPDPRQPLSICLIDRASGRLIEVVGRTHAWNWQQGARAMWLDDQRFIYNIFDEERGDYGACIGRPGTEYREFIPLPVQEWDRNGRIYSLSYAALGKYRPDYGYRNRAATDEDLAGNALLGYELASGSVRCHVTLESLVTAVRAERGEQPRHAKLNHALASPSGARVVFLCRYLLRDRRVTDLHALDPITDRQWRLLADAQVSHFCWLDDQSLLLTGNPGPGFGYYRLNVTAGTWQSVTVGPDGHPSRAGANIVTDTYPDGQGFRRLLCLEEDASCRWREIARFVDPVLLHGEMRCDLHPVASQCGRWLKVDVASGRRRCVAVCDLQAL